MFYPIQCQLTFSLIAKLKREKSMPDYFFNLNCCKIQFSSITISETKFMDISALIWKKKLTI
jgi:hypothetical protein